GNVVISIVDLSGKKIDQISTMLSKGPHGFLISGIRQGIFFVTVTGDNFTYTTKLVSTSDGQSDARIESVSSVKNPLENPLKSTKTTVMMKYTTGDLLLYKGTSGQYGTLITDTPTSSATVIFYFALCKDKDGNNYSIVKIHDQTWMAENLNTTHYGNGDFLFNPTDTSLWANMAEGAYCDYANTPANSATYGKLYNFYAAADPRKICPYGWHTPSDPEWTTLTNFLGSVVGGKLKETGIAHWQSPNTGATDEIGFTALPGGYRFGDGTFYNMNAMACFWSATGETSLTAWSRILSYNYDYVTREEDHKTHGYSVRCVKD
ncbi:MAG TPA: FISUMP domain-containing protein, partial [Methylococcales bacterium]